MLTIATRWFYSTSAAKCDPILLRWARHVYVLSISHLVLVPGQTCCKRAWSNPTWWAQFSSAKISHYKRWLTKDPPRLRNSTSSTNGRNTRTCSIQDCQEPSSYNSNGNIVHWQACKWNLPGWEGNGAMQFATGLGTDSTWRVERKINSNKNNWRSQLEHVVGRHKTTRVQSSIL